MRLRYGQERFEHLEPEARWKAEEAYENRAMEQADKRHSKDLYNTSVRCKRYLLKLKKTGVDFYSKERVIISINFWCKEQSPNVNFYARHIESICKAVL